MNINAKKHPSYQHDKEAAMSGVGANAIWNGPFDSTGLPKGKGSSSGSNGIKLSFDEPSCNGGSIIQRVKAKQ